jgi:predicted ABC-type sugar transport system permease subunit
MLELQLLFRCFQFNFNVGMKTVEIVGPIFLTQGTAILIASLCAILFHNVPEAEFVLILLGIISFVAILAIRNILALVIKLTESSTLFPKSYLKNKLRLRKVDRKFYASCPPFIVRLGLLTINRQTFLLVMNDVVVFSVINLLIAFR